MVAATTRQGPSNHEKHAADGAVSPEIRASASARAAAYDAELVRRFRDDGSEQAFEEIVSRYRGKMFAIAYAHLRNRGDAEEIAQDTFIRAYRNLANFRGDSSLATWLQCIATNLARNRYWYFFCRRRHATQSLDKVCSDENQSTLADLIASDSPGPATTAATNEFSSLVGECIEKLGDRQREILTLRAGLNKSYHDISRALGISIGTVKSRIGRARKDLRAQLVRSYPEAANDASSVVWFEPNRPGGGAMSPV